MRARSRTLAARSWDSVSGLFRLRDARTAPAAKTRLGLEPLEPREVPAARLPISLFDTGTAANGSLLGDNATDPHYRLIDANTVGLMPGAARTLVADGFPIGPWVGNAAGSRWIVPAGSDGDGNAAAGTYVYRTTVDLSRIDPASATLTGQWAADNDAAIYLNGVATGFTVGAEDFGTLTAFTLTAGFRPGSNDLDFVVHNGGGPTGLRVDGLTGSGLPGARVAVPRAAFNTGVDALGQPLPDSSAPKATGLNSTGAGLGDLASDGNFAVTAAPSGYAGGTKVRKAVGGFPIPTWAGDTTGSAWLIPAAADAQGNAPPGVYSFATTVTVTDPTDLVLSGRWAADNAARIYVNGTDTGVVLAGPEAFRDMTPFMLSGSYLVAGTNAVEFRVTNLGTGDNPVGVRVEWDPAATRIDPHFAVVSAPDPSLVGPAKVVPASGYPLPPWVANDANSRWVAPLRSAADASAPPGTYVFETTIDLTGYQASTAVLTGRWSADNEGVDVYLNGTALDLHRTGPNPGSGVEGFRAYSDFAISTGWVAGVNTLRFEVRNDPLASGSTTPNPVGLRVDDVQLYAVPVPAVAVAASGRFTNETGEPVAFVFTRTADPSDALTVSYLVEGTAIPGVDFAGPTGTVTFEPGESSVVVPLVVTSDGASESAESVFVELIPGAGYTFQPDDSNWAMVTITDEPLAWDEDTSDVDLDEDGDVDGVEVDTDGDGLFESVDLGGNGRIDGLGVDLDLDGEFDGVGLDTDDDGRIDAVDRDGDGVADEAAFDIDGDDYIDGIGVDADDDGETDLIDLDGDGIYDGVLVDLDGDGNPDAVGVDTDGDGWIDDLDPFGGPVEYISAPNRTGVTLDESDIEKLYNELIKLGREDVAFWYVTDIRVPKYYETSTWGHWLTTPPTVRYEQPDGKIVLEVRSHNGAKPIADWAAALVDLADSGDLKEFNAYYYNFVLEDPNLDAGTLTPGSRIPQQSKDWLKATMAAAPGLMVGAAFRLALDVAPTNGAGKVLYALAHKGLSFAKLGGKWALRSGDAVVNETVLGKIVAKITPAGTLKYAESEAVEWVGRFCFPPDTLVHTSRGLVPIGRVNGGDKVWAFRFATGDWALQTVAARKTSTYHGTLVSLVTGAGFVEATDAHPVWIVRGLNLRERPACPTVVAGEDESRNLDGRWVAARDVLAGDVMYTRGGMQCEILQVITRESTTEVCSLAVEEHPNFAVGADGLLVHNDTCWKDLITQLTGRAVPAVLKTPALAGKVHGHHIVMKAKDLTDVRKPWVEGAQKILEKYNIPILATKEDAKTYQPVS